MAPKAKANGSANGSAPKGKPSKAITPSPSASGTATPLLSEDVKAGSASRVGRPDKAAYDTEQETLKKEIAELQEKMAAIQAKINAGSNAGPGAERRAELRAEWDKIRQEQGSFKSSREQIIQQLKAMNENIHKKVKDLQAAKGKTQFKSVAEVDAHIKQLEKQVETGTMKLVDEKRALQEISQTKRLRRTVEGFQADQEIIDKDRAAADELKKQLDDPESIAVHNRAQAVKAELDELKKAGDEAYANRNKLFDERNALKAQVDELYTRKRESTTKYKEENDQYWQKVSEDRARRAERARAQRQAEEEAKKKEQALRIREEAEAPAFQDKIDDCQTLIDYFSGKTTGAIRLSSQQQQQQQQQSAAAAKEVAGVPKLEIRKVDANANEGLVVRKKKGEDEEAYFVGGKGKAKGKKGGNNAKAQSQANGNGDADATTTATPSASSASGALNVPLPTLSALLSLSIPPPVSAGDVARCVADLKTKKAWFEANQDRVTAENVAKAEANIKKLMAKEEAASASASSPSASAALAKDEKPAEPAPTPSEPDSLSSSVPSGEVKDILQDIQEVQKEVEAEAA